MMHVRTHMVCDKCDETILDDEGYEFKKKIYCLKCAGLFTKEEKEKGNQYPIFKAIVFKRY